MSEKQRKRTKSTGLGADAPIAGADILFAEQPETEPVEAEKAEPKKQTERRSKQDGSGGGERKKTSFYVLRETHDLLQYMQATSILKGEKQTIGHFVEEAVKLYAKTHEIELPEDYKRS